MKTEGKCRHFRELTLNLQRAGFTVERETPDGLLPVELDGRHLCLVTGTGGVRYRKEDVAGAVRGAALEKVIDIAMTTTEYMRQMEAAPFLKADGLDEGYRLLAEFGGTVLAGQQTRYGVQFITWARTYDGSGVTQGHYHGFSGTEGYTFARQDFAVRSGLVPRSALFSPEQLTELYRSIHESLENVYPITMERQKCLESAAKQIEQHVPDLDERVALSNQKEVELAAMESPQEGGMQFS